MPALTSFRLGRRRRGAAALTAAPLASVTAGAHRVRAYRGFAGHRRCAPRASSAGCHAGAPGDAVAAPNTDGLGGGAVTLSSPITSGATGS